MPYLRRHFISWMAEDALKPLRVEGATHVCPECGSPVDHELDCAGYPSKDINGVERVMVCYPPCGGADYFECSNQTCFWWYRTPNRRKDTFYVHGQHDVPMGVSPTWLEAWHENFYPDDNDEDGDGDGDGDESDA